MNIKKLNTLILTIIISFILVSCGTKEPEQNVNKEYTITWINDNGDVLEVDKNVSEGIMPTYDGSTPTKEPNGKFTYIFTGWSPEVVIVNQDITYRAVYKEVNSSEIFPGIDPVFSDDMKTLVYGFYPQTYVSDINIISELNILSPNSNGWYLYNNEYYVKEIANVYNNENYTFDDGTKINNGSEYWFKCELITWNVVSNSNGAYKLVSLKLLDAHNYYNDYVNRNINNQIIYPNNYEYSNIRSWLNNEFCNLAFSQSNNYIKLNENDKVSLLSYSDYLNNEYGFDSINNKSLTREAKTTDYARVRGAWCNTREDLGTTSLYNGTYWTNTSSNYFYASWIVNSGGYLSAYAVDGTSHCIRPTITITL